MAGENRPFGEPDDHVPGERAEFAGSRADATPEFRGLLADASGSGQDDLRRQFYTAPNPGAHEQPAGHDAGEQAFQDMVSQPSHSSGQAAQPQQFESEQSDGSHSDDPQQASSHSESEEGQSESGQSDGKQLEQLETPTTTAGTDEQSSQRDEAGVADQTAPVAENLQEDEHDEEWIGDDEPFDFGIDDDDEDAAPIESLVEEQPDDEEIPMEWYILKVQVNRESSICDALRRRVKVAGFERFFGDILVPTEDVREFSKTGKQRIVKKKLYPGYIVVRMALNDETWFLVRETPGIGDFTGAVGKPAPLTAREIEPILATSIPDESKASEEHVRTAIRFKTGDRVRVKEGYFQNYEGEVSNIDERNGRVTVMINIFGRPNPVELDHWQVEQI